MNALLAQCTTANISKPKHVDNMSQSHPSIVSIGTADYREHNVTSKINQDNAVVYVAGYLLKKSLRCTAVMNAREF